VLYAIINQIVFGSGGGLDIYKESMNDQRHVGLSNPELVVEFLLIGILWSKSSFWFTINSTPEPHDDRDTEAI